MIVRIDVKFPANSSRTEAWRSAWVWLTMGQHNVVFFSLRLCHSSWYTLQLCIASRHDMCNKCWINAGPTSQRMGLSMYSGSQVHIDKHFRERHLVVYQRTVPQLLSFWIEIKLSVMAEKKHANYTFFYGNAFKMKDWKKIMLIEYIPENKNK